MQLPKGITSEIAVRCIELRAWQMYADKRKATLGYIPPAILDDICRAEALIHAPRMGHNAITTDHIDRWNWQREKL